MAKVHIWGSSESCFCRKISFNCTLIAHENVTTELFFFAVWGKFVLFYSELSFIWLCWVVFFASETGFPERMSHLCEEMFFFPTLVFISDTTLADAPANVVLPSPQKTTTAAEVQVEHTGGNKKKNYARNTLNRNSRPPHMQSFEETCVCVCM